LAELAIILKAILAISAILYIGGIIFKGF